MLLTAGECKRRTQIQNLSRLIYCMLEISPFLCVFISLVTRNYFLADPVFVDGVFHKRNSGEILPCVSSMEQGTRRELMGQICVIGSTGRGILWCFGLHWKFMCFLCAATYAFSAKKGIWCDGGLRFSSISVSLVQSLDRFSFPLSFS